MVVASLCDVWQDSVEVSRFIVYGFLIALAMGWVKY